MSRTRPIIVCFSIMVLLFLVSSCASVEKGKKQRQGITGALMPVDEYGNEIVHLKKEKILVNLVPIVDGERLFDSSFSFNPQYDGVFSRVISSGEYTVEVFLEGFYVRSFDITVHEGETLDLGTIRIERIETDLGAPVMGEKNDGVILNEGDVNIGPPSF